MKKTILILAGFLPLAVGYGAEVLLGAQPETRAVYGCAAAFSVLWLAAAVVLRPLARSTGELTLLLHLPLLTDALGLVVLWLLRMYAPGSGAAWMPAAVIWGLRPFVPLLWAMQALLSWCNELALFLLLALGLMLCLAASGGALWTYIVKREQRV